MTKCMSREALRSPTKAFAVPQAGSDGFYFMPTATTRIRLKRIDIREELGLSCVLAGGTLPGFYCVSLVTMRLRDVCL